VTVTHPEMQRYFMTIPEACQLILQAGALGKGGEIFILDMGKPVRIVDVASDLIRLSGLVPGQDIEITFTGMRPGEKLFEELSVAEEAADQTRHPKIFVAHTREQSWDNIAADLDALLALAHSHDQAQSRAELRRIIPEYAPPEPQPAPDPSRVVAGV